MIVCFDSIDVSQIPLDAPAVAGYVGGHWPTFFKLVQERPHAHLLSIAVNAAETAECLDVEKGDASTADIGTWLLRAHRTMSRPVIYAAISNMPAVLAALTAAGVPRSRVRLWAAHYTHSPHVCTASCWAGLPAGFEADGTQWTDRALGRNLDESLMLQSFWPERASAAPTMTPAPAKRKAKIRPAVKQAAAGVHPKTAAATGAGGLVVALVGILHGSGLLHGVSAAEWSALAAAAASVAAYLAPARAASA